MIPEALFQTSMCVDDIIALQKDANVDFIGKLVTKGTPYTRSGNLKSDCSLEDIRGKCIGVTFTSLYFTWREAAQYVEDKAKLGDHIQIKGGLVAIYQKIYEIRTVPATVVEVFQS